MPAPYPTPNPTSQNQTWSLTAMIRRLLGIVTALAGIGLILWLDDWFMGYTDMPDLSQNMSHGLLLLVGFLTSFHCVGMCGPLIVGYTANAATRGIPSRLSHLQYGIGKTISYTAIGALLGAFGAVLAFTPQTQGLVGIAAGIFLILFGLHMLNAFAGLRHFYIRPPALLTRLVSRGYRKPRHPLVIGLLNGLMVICGPLQAMYVMAAGSGGWIEGGRIMFLFGLGTLPLLMGFGFLTSLVSANLTPKLLKASGIIVVILGTIMLNRGMALAGSGWDLHSLEARVSAWLSPGMADTPSCEQEQVIRMEVVAGQFLPNHFVLKKSVPVKWVIDAKALNKCNQSLVVPSLGMRFDVQPGVQTIEFVPSEVGVVAWSCWMGMIPGSFLVVEDTAPAPASGHSGLQAVGEWLDHGMSASMRLGARLIGWFQPKAVGNTGKAASQTD